MSRLREPGGPVLQLPVDPAAPFEAQLGAQALAMYESIGHWRPLLNGYGGFFPSAFVERMRLAARLPDAAALTELRRDSGLVQVVVRRDLATGELRERWERLAHQGGGEGLHLVAQDDTRFLFSVD